MISKKPEGNVLIRKCMCSLDPAYLLLHELTFSLSLFLSLSSVPCLSYAHILARLPAVAITLLDSGFHDAWPHLLMNFLPGCHGVWS
jgi:hypothetical protein